MPERWERMSKSVMDWQGYDTHPAVVRMTQQQEGAFFRLVRKAWWMPTPGVIEDDDDLLRALTRTPVDEWPETRAALERFYDTITRPGFWIDHLMVESYRSQSLYHDSQVAKGKKGASVRWGDHSAAIAALLPKHGGSVRSGSAQSGLAQSRDTLQRAAEVETQALFDDYWTRYPKKADPKLTAEWWRRHVRNVATAQRVVRALDWFIENEWRGRRVEDFPNSYYFLKKKRWKDAAPGEGA